MGLADRFRAFAKRPVPLPAERPGPWVILAAWGPCGFVPVAPGTAGTLGAVPLWWALSRLHCAAAVPAAAVLLLLLGVVAARHAGRYWGVTDAPPIVIDEVVGYLCTVLLVPFSWPAAWVGFVLFRILDTTKPWPASAFDRLKSPWGVMLDDVAAGLYGMLLLWAAVRLLPGWFA
jgi:phosphatidylglycerophosphatase A